MNINELKPGRELDALVAEKVMGWARIIMADQAWADVSNNWHSDYMGTVGGKRTVIPLFSTDIAAAWEVVEKFDDYGVWRHEGQAKHHAEFKREFGKWKRWAAEGESASHAICLAALKALIT